MRKASLPAIIVDAAPRQMTLQEAEESTGQIKRGIGSAAVHLYAIHEYAGWKAMGFEDFQAYYEGALDMPTSTAYHWLQRVEASLSVNGCTIDDYLGGNREPNLLSQKTAAEIVKLPKDLRALAYGELETIKASGTRMESQYIHPLRKIVDRLLMQTQPESAPVTSEVIATPPMTPPVTKNGKTSKPKPKAAEPVEEEEFESIQDFTESAPVTSERTVIETTPVTSEVIDDDPAPWEPIDEPVAKVPSVPLMRRLTATEVEFNGGWVVARYVDGNEVISIKFEAIPHEKVIVAAGGFIRMNDDC